MLTLDEIIKRSPVAYWLMACYAYEELDAQIMTDVTFDALCEWIFDNWLDVMEHPHANLLDPEFLKSSIGARKPRHQWPLVIFGATHQLLDELHGPRWGDPGASYMKRLKAVGAC